jgi:hypothetical protein
LDNNYAYSFVNGTVTVLAWTVTGFYQPVDMSPIGTIVWNTVKGGSTVPLKFDIYAGTDEQTSTSAVSGFQMTPVSCSISALSDDVEFTTTGGTSLRYDTVAGQFIQNWQTPRRPGECYLTRMTAADGSYLEAYFKIK